MSEPTLRLARPACSKPDQAWRRRLGCLRLGSEQQWSPSQHLFLGKLACNVPARPPAFVNIHLILFLSSTATLECLAVVPCGTLHLCTMRELQSLLLCQRSLVGYAHGRSHSFGLHHRLSPRAAHVWRFVSFRSTSHALASLEQLSQKAAHTQSVHSSNVIHHAVSKNTFGPGVQSETSSRRRRIFCSDESTQGTCNKLAPLPNRPIEWSLTVPTKTRAQLRVRSMRFPYVVPALTMQTGPCPAPKLSANHLII